MKIKLIITSFVLSLVFPIMLKSEAFEKSNLKEESVTYSVDNKLMHGFVVYDTKIIGKRPAILVIPEWWGLNDYAKNRARQLAELGYIAMAVDMYGDGKVAENPQEAQQLTSPFYQNPSLSKIRVDAAIKKLKQYSQTDPSNIAAIGYCFGGSVVLNSAKLGADLKGVVSFHGGLAGAPARKDLLKAKILVCNGGADKFVSAQDIAAFRHGLDSIQADYTFKTYAGATHAFTNPDATRIGQQFNMPIAYNEEADKASWEDMKNFFHHLFVKK